MTLSVNMRRKKHCQIVVAGGRFQNHGVFRTVSFDHGRFNLMPKTLRGRNPNRVTDHVSHT